MRKNILFSAIGAASLALILGAFVFTGTMNAYPRGVSTLPNVADTVPTGTHFLVRLDDELNSGKDKINKKFSVKTIEPLETSSGSILLPGRKFVDTSAELSRAASPAGRVCG